MYSSPNNPQLPPGWEAKFDPANNRWFYMNHFTKTTQWEKPQLQVKPVFNPPKQQHFQYAPRPQTKVPNFMIADPQKVAKLKSDYGVDEELAKSLLCSHINNLNAVEDQLKDMGYKKKILHAESSSTPITPDPTKVSILVSLYGVKEPLALSILRTHSNNLESSISAIRNMGYAKKQAKPIEPKQEYIDLMKNEYRSASVSTISAQLSKTNNSLVETSKALENLGFRRQAAKKETEKKTPKISTEQAMRELKRKFTSLDHTMLSLCLKVSGNNVEMATKILEAKQKKDDQAAPTTSRSIEAEPEEAPRDYTPKVFGGDTSVAKVEIPSFVSASAAPKKDEPTPPVVRTRNQNVFAKKRYKPKKKKQVVGYKSTLRTEPMGPDPTLIKGPDPSLLLQTFSEKRGPDRANCKGPKSNIRCGPDAANHVGPAQLAVGPSRLLEIAA